jgi:8-oxo-dGTP diphosphatase
MVVAIGSNAARAASICSRKARRSRSVTVAGGCFRYEPIGFNLLPPTFTIAQLHALYEAVLGRDIYLPNFRRSVMRHHLLKEAGEEEDVSHRPAKLYHFDEKAYARLLKSGSSFEV